MVLQNDPVATDAFRRRRDHLLRHRTDLAAARRGLPPVELGHFNWSFDWFDVVAARRRGPALIVVDDASSASVTFPELARASLRAAAWLHTLGVRRGDRVLLALENRIELWQLLLAGIRLGAVLVPCHTGIAHADLRERAERVGATAVCRDAELVDAAAPARIAVAAGAGPCPNGWQDYREARNAAPEFPRTFRTRADEVLFLYFTSGTTARPKLVAHTHVSYPIGHLSGMYWNGLRPGDRHLNLAAPGWAKHAWSSLFAPYAAEATGVATAPRAPRPELVLRALVEHRVTSLCAPPAAWRRLAECDLTRHPVRLREATSAGEPLEAAVVERVRRDWGVRVRDGYGQTETTAQIGVTPADRAPAGSLGRPLPGYEIALLDPETGRAARHGEIVVAGDPAPIGLTPGSAGADGWYRTGDLARLDADGYVYFVGRRDDVFKSRGHRVSPPEVEHVLLTHPAVLEAAVVAWPDARLGTVPKAFVGLAAGAVADTATAVRICRHAALALPPHAVPRRVQFGTLPRTASGKVRRAELRELPPIADFAVPATGDEGPDVPL